MRDEDKVITKIFGDRSATMEKRRILITVAILVIALCMAGVGWAAPMGTAFTYQGRLVDANSPAEGVYDFEFEIYDALDGGGQQGSTVSKDDVDVIDSYFTTELDFGSSVFTGDARWLQVAVRPGASSDPCDFATLSPRQKLTPTPYAMHSENTDKLDSFDSSAFASSGHDHDSDYALISHIHDDRYYTETELGSSGSSSVHWDNLTSVPAGLADGDDVGIIVESDPTVLTSVKDGVSWGEVSSRPSGLDDGDDVKDGVSWGELSAIPAGFSDGVDDVGIISESDPQVGSNAAYYIPKWNGSALVSGTIYDTFDSLIGIGTVDPDEKLHVVGSVTATIDLIAGVDVDCGDDLKLEDDIDLKHDNETWIGDTSNACERVYSYDFYNVSSRDKKHDIQPLNEIQLREMLDTIDAVDVVHFLYKDEVLSAESGATEDDSKLRFASRLGVIAETLPPEVVDNTGKRVNLTSYTAMLHAALKEMNSLVKSQEEKIIDLKARLEVLENNKTSTSSGYMKGGI